MIKPGYKGANMFLEGRSLVYTVYNITGLHGVFPTKAAWDFLNV